MVPADFVRSRLVAEGQRAVGHQIVQHLAEFIDTRIFDNPAGDILNLFKRQRSGYTASKTTDD